MKVRIETNGKPLEDRVTDASTGEDIAGCYRYEVVGQVGETTKVTLFLHDKGNVILWDAEVLNVPLGLRERAARIANQSGNEAVVTAMTKLLGPLPMNDIPE